MNHPGSYTLNVALTAKLPITPHWGFLLHAVSGVSFFFLRFSGCMNSFLGSFELCWLERDAGGSCEYSCFPIAVLLGIECLYNSY